MTLTVTITMSPYESQYDTRHGLFRHCQTLDMRLFVYDHHLHGTWMTICELWAEACLKYTLAGKHKCVECVCVFVMCEFLTVWDGAGHWLVIVDVAAGNRPHRVAPVIVGTDKQVSRAFPHQALQLLQGGSHTRMHTSIRQSHQTGLHGSRIGAYRYTDSPLTMSTCWHLKEFLIKVRLQSSTSFSSYLLTGFSLPKIKYIKVH